ncbi:putative FMN-binding regulatory protein PaiB [Bradyrhizobium sp. USDA 4473]
MYTPPVFKPDRAASLGFAEARGFGLACAWDGGKPIAAALPFYLTVADGSPRALFHVARHNPLVKLAGGAASGTSWLLAATGADAYVMREVRPQAFAMIQTEMTALPGSEQ